MPRAEDVEVSTIQRSELRLVEPFDDREDRRVHEPRVGIGVAIADLPDARVVFSVQFLNLVCTRADVVEESDENTVSRGSALVGLLIDSTAFIRAERQRQTPEQLIAEVVDRWGDVELAMSVMSTGELFHGCWRADTPSRRARREEFVEAILAAVPVVPITLPIARLFGQIDARMSTDGRRIPTSDLLIACTALWRGDEIVTGNFRYFDRVPGLTVHHFA